MKKRGMILGFVIFAVGIISFFSSWGGITGMVISEAPGFTPVKTISVIMIFLGTFLFVLSSRGRDKQNKSENKEKLVKFEYDDDEDESYLEDDESQYSDYNHPVYTG